MTRELLTSSVLAYIHEYWRNFAVGIPFRALAARWQASARRAGVPLDQLMHELVGRGELHAVMLRTGGRLIFPRAVWDTLSSERQIALTHGPKRAAAPAAGSAEKRPASVVQFRPDPFFTRRDDESGERS